MTKPINRHSKGMQERRMRILASAADLIGREGIDGLTTRKLAEAAGVTTPTLYNLIGSKDEIVRQAFEANVEAVWSSLDFSECDGPVEMADKIVRETARFVLSNEAANRELILATDRLTGFYAPEGDLGHPVSRAAQRSIEMGEAVAERAVASGDAASLVSTGELGQQLFMSFRGPLRDWAHGLVSSVEMQCRQLLGFYLLLAGVARDDLRDELQKRIGMVDRIVAGWSKDEGGN